MALVSVLWALCYPLIATGLAMAPPLYFAALRSFVAGIGLIAPALVLRRPFPSGWLAWVMIIGVGFTTTALGFSGMFLAGELISPGLATILGNTQPLIAAVLAYLVLGEHLGSGRKKGLAFGSMGILLIALPGLVATSLYSSPSGIGYIFIGAFGTAIGNVLLKLLAGRVDLLMAMGWQFVIGGLPLLISAWKFEAPAQIDWNLPFIVNLLVLGLAGTALAYGIWFALLHRTELTRLNIFTFLAPVLAIVIGVLFFFRTF